MSRDTEYPTTVAEYLRCVVTSTTLNFVAPLMTWLFVRTSPERVRIIPVPAASPSW